MLRADAPVSHMQLLRWREAERTVGVKMNERDKPTRPCQGRHVLLGLEGADFVPAASFMGSVPESVFRLGEHGLGYYRDVASAPLVGVACVSLSSCHCLPKRAPSVCMQRLPPREGGHGERVIVMVGGADVHQGGRRPRLHN